VPSPILADKAFIRATITNFFFFFGLNCFILLPLYIEGAGGTAIEIGLVMGLYNAMGILCQPLVGPLVDALGRRPFMLAGTVLAAVAALFATLAPSIPVLAGVRALQGIAFSAFFVANYSYVIDLTPPAHRGWALGIYGVAGLVATAIAPLIGEGMIRRTGFRPLFCLAAVMALAAAGYVWSLPSGRPGRPLTLPGSRWERGGLGELRHRHMAVTLFFGLGAGTIFVFLPTFSDSLGVATLSLFYTAFAVSAIGVRVFGGRLIDTHGRRAVIVPSMFVQAGAVALLALLGFVVSRTSLTPVVPVLFIAGLMSGGAHGLLYPGLATLVTDHASETRRGVVIAMFSAVFLVGQTVGSFAFGYITHVIGYAFMWTMLASFLLLGAALSMSLADRRAA
jgi:MFS family permease